MNKKKEIKKMRSMTDDEITVIINNLTVEIRALDEEIYSPKAEELDEDAIDKLTNKRFKLGAEKSLRQDFIDRRRRREWQQKMDDFWSIKNKV